MMNKDNSEQFSTEHDVSLNPDSMISRRDFLSKSLIGGAGLVMTEVFRKNTADLKSFNQRIIGVEEESNISTLIEKYGTALTIPAFEYHGDAYSMFDDCYNMNSETFENQMNWFKDNEYHAVTGKELIGFLDGTIDLPGRSVILTTDSGNTSQKSIPRMINVLKDTGMHFHSFVWTKDMTEEESLRCEGDRCWNLFRTALNSGCFTIGCHTETHRDFGTINQEEGIEELLQSKREIEDNIGTEIYSISWPFEVSPYWAKELTKIGFQYAFGGRSKPLYYCSVEKEDEFRWNLPRILPPNINGFSGRPNGEKIDSIMRKFNKSTKDNPPKEN